MCLDSLKSSHDVDLAFFVFPRWDLLRGRDVFRDAELFEYETMNADSAHFAPNCATFSRAREIPIPGVSCPPKPLRSSLHPRGIPEERSKLSKRARLRMDRDTEMAADSARRCIIRHKIGLPFSLEHPGRSIALDLEEWKSLMSMEGVYCTFYHTCMFEGSRRRKYQILIHNQKELQELGRECPSNGLCLRTGKPHEKWRPLVSKGRVEQFITGEEREYPPGFCSAYAIAMTKAVRTKRVKSFCEIYFGPNAPLTQAMVSEFGGCIPDVHMSLEKAPASSKAEALSLDRRTALGLILEGSEVPTSRERPSAESRVESTTLRSSAVEAGRQPSFGKRTQMIGDGINDPLRHLKEATGLKHPFDSTSSVKEDHVRNTIWEKD